LRGRSARRRPGQPAPTSHVCLCPSGSWPSATRSTTCPFATARSARCDWRTDVIHRHATGNGRSRP
jgi:hypothetical protein